MYSSHKVVQYAGFGSSVSRYDVHIMTHTYDIEVEVGCCGTAPAGCK